MLLCVCVFVCVCCLTAGAVRGTSGAQAVMCIERPVCDGWKGAVVCVCVCVYDRCMKTRAIVICVGFLSPLGLSLFVRNLPPHSARALLFLGIRSDALC